MYVYLLKNLRDFNLKVRGQMPSFLKKPVNMITQEGSHIGFSN